MCKCKPKLLTFIKPTCHEKARCNLPTHLILKRRYFFIFQSMISYQVCIINSIKNTKHINNLQNNKQHINTMIIICSYKPNFTLKRLQKLKKNDDFCYKNLKLANLLIIIIIKIKIITKQISTLSQSQFQQLSFSFFAFFQDSF